MERGASQRAALGRALRRLLSSNSSPVPGNPTFSMRQIVLARREAEAVGAASRIAREKRRSSERQRFGLPVFEFVLGGALAVGLYAYTISGWLDAPGLFNPRPSRGRPLPPHVAALISGNAGALSGEHVYAYGRRWPRSAMRCAQCKRNLLKRGEPCFLHVQAAPDAPAASAGAAAAAGAAVAVEGEVLLCAQHYAQAHCTTCSLCARQFEAGGRPPLLLPTGEAFCASHQHNVPCFSCARPIGRADAAARPLCAQCRSSAIVSEQAAAELLRELKGFFLSAGLDFGRWEPAQLRLVSSPPGGGGFGAEGGHLEGLTHRASSAGVRAVPSIDLLHGLPREHAAQVLVHEMAHAWLWLQGHPRSLPRRTEEGVCELLAYLWLLSEEAHEAAGAQALSPRRRELLQRIRVMEQRSDRAYGGGFRDALRATEQRGLQAVLHSVHTRGKLPGRPRARAGW